MLKTFNEYLARVCAGFDMRQPLSGQPPGNINGNITSSTHGTLPLIGCSKALPNPLPSGVSAYILISMGGNVAQSVALPLLIAKAVKFGSINLATNVWTHLSAMPTVTELGVSRRMSSALVCVNGTNISSSPGAVTITYQDQDGNTEESTGALNVSGSSLRGDGSIIVLNGSDWAVQDVTNVVQSGGSSPTGTLDLYGLVHLGMLTSTSGATSGTSGQTSQKDGLITTPNPIRLGAGDQVCGFGMQGGSNVQAACLCMLGFVGDTIG